MINFALKTILTMAVWIALFVYMDIAMGVRLVTPYDAWTLVGFCFFISLISIANMVTFKEWFK